MVSQQLDGLYALYNSRYFEGTLPPCRMVWSRQLTRTAGNIDVRRRIMKLSVPLLIDAYNTDSLFGAEHEICGVLCASRDEALREIMKHEMIHLWLHEQGLPSGHTAAFRDKACELGQSKIRHQIALPTPRGGWIYRCAGCGNQFSRRRRYSRPVACANCCKRFNRGQFDERFRLRGHRITN